LGLSICTIAALLGSTRALNIGPRMALTSQYLTESYSHKPLLERLFERFLGPNKILARVPLRNLFRHGRRTTITVLAIAVSMVLVVSSMGLTLNFIQPLQRNYDSYEKWDLKVTLAGYQGEAQVLDKLSSPNMNGLKGEAMIDDYTGLKTGSGVKFVHIQAFEENSALRSFNVIKGTKDLKNGVLVGSILAKKQDIKVGDTLTFVMADHTSQAKVTGITGELLDDSVLMTLNTASTLFGSGMVANSLILDTGSLSHSQIESMIRGSFNVASIVYTSDVLDGMTVFLNGVIALMTVFIMFGVVAEVLFISSTVVLNIIERDQEFISLRAMGTDPGRILRMVTNESLLLLIPSVVIGIIISDLSTSWITTAIIKDLMYYKIVVGASTYVAATVIAIISAYLASYVSARHITKLKLVDAIRQRMLT
jgi:putative ABC transport system permease protein